MEQEESLKKEVEMQEKEVSFGESDNEQDDLLVNSFDFIFDNSSSLLMEDASISQSSQSSQASLQTQTQERTQTSIQRCQPIGFKSAYGGKIPGKMPGKSSRDIPKEESIEEDSIEENNNEEPESDSALQIKRKEDDRIAKSITEINQNQAALLYLRQKTSKKFRDVDYKHEYAEFACDTVLLYTYTKVQKMLEKSECEIMKKIVKKQQKMGVNTEYLKIQEEINRTMKLSCAIFGGELIRIIQKACTDLVEEKRQNALKYQRVRKASNGKKK